MAAVKTYLFKPKPSDPTKLVVVVAEENKHIGGASALAKTLGFKDMRAAEESYVSEIFQGKSKATGAWADGSYLQERKAQQEILIVLSFEFGLLQ